MLKGAEEVWVIVEALWREVLLIALNDALQGTPESASIDKVRPPMDGRDDILVLNPDFTLVCSLAGLEPEAVKSEFAARLARLGSGRLPCTWRNLTAGPKPPIRADIDLPGPLAVFARMAGVSGMPGPLLMNCVNRRGCSLKGAPKEPVGRRMPKPSRSDQEHVRSILRDPPAFEARIATEAGL